MCSMYVRHSAQLVRSFHRTILATQRILHHPSPVLRNGHVGTQSVHDSKEGKKKFTPRGALRVLQYLPSRDIYKRKNTG